MEERLIDDLLKYAYFAGLFDGEGSVWINRSPRANGRVYYHSGVILSNTDREVVDRLQKEFGGKITVRISQAKDLYKWSLCGDDADQFIKSIKRYSIIKRERLLLFEKFKETFSKNGAKPRVTAEVENERFNYFVAMKRLNQRGLSSEQGAF